MKNTEFILNTKLSRIHLLIFSLILVNFLTAEYIYAGSPSHPSPFKSKSESLSILLRPSQAKDHILIKFKDASSSAAQEKILSKHNLKEKSELKDIKVKIVSVSNDDTIEEVIQRLKIQDDEKIEFAEPDFIAHSLTTPNDPYYPSQWHLAKISASDAWTISTGKPDVVIAVIDSGADPAHPDLLSKLIPGWNFLNGTSNTKDSGANGGHGTAVAGTAAAAANNGIGVSGVSWNNAIMPLEVLNSSDFAYYSDIANALAYAVEHGAKVVNISIGGSSDSLTMQNAINNAWNKGLVIVASAGNGGNSSPVYPAADQNVLAVSATNDNTDNMASFSTYGNFIDMAAPGNNILTTNNGGGYGYWYGTSFASPIVAGLAAMIFSENPSLNNTQVVNLLEQNADDLGTPGWDQYYGYGRVNAYRALSAAAQITTDTIPPSSPTGLQTSAISSTQINLSWLPSSDNVGALGYNIYRNNFLLKTTPETLYTDSSVSPATNYNYSVAAYDRANNVSAPSGTITVTTPNAVSSVTVTGYQVVSKTSSSATIKWTTNISSTGSVAYGTTSASLYFSTADNTLGTSHSVNLTRLTRSTIYYYKISAKSLDGTSTNTSISTFKTNKR